MANGTFGTTKPAFITSKDVDIYYHYRPTRSSESENFKHFKKLDSNLLANSKAVLSEGGSTVEVLPGMYNMRLPLNIFGNVGIYTIYIKPKEYYGKITDISTLSDYPEIGGIVIDTADFGENDSSIFTNGNLVGYRVEYFENNERSDTYRIITSNNRCEPISFNLNATKKGIKYIFNSQSNLIFCTLSNTTEMSFNPSNGSVPGQVGQKIALVNTNFNPVMLEVEMVRHDIDSLYALQSNTQLRDLNKGLITTFDDDGNIIEQALYGNITNPSEDINHDFKIRNTTTISFDQEVDLRKIKENI